MSSVLIRFVIQKCMCVFCLPVFDLELFLCVFMNSRVRKNVERLIFGVDLSKQNSVNYALDLYGE